MSATIVLALVLVLALALTILFLQPQHHPQYGGSQSNEHRIFPLHNPFSNSFYQKPHHASKIYARNRDLHRPLIIHTIGAHLFQSTMRGIRGALVDLNNGNLDYVIDTELNIAPALKTVNVPNIRYICSLYASTLILIVPNSVNIIDIGDIKHINCEIRIAVSGEEQRRALLHVLEMYPEIHTEIDIVDESVIKKEYGHKYQIYADLILETNSLVRTLTDQAPSHLVSMHKINAGSYYITDSERPFYQKYPYFRKDMIDIIDLHRQYPQLSQVHNRDIYYSTVNCRYILLTRSSQPDKDVSEVLHKVLFLLGLRYNMQQGYPKISHAKREQLTVSRFFEGTTAADIGHTSTSITVHSGAEAVYRDIRLII